MAGFIRSTEWHYDRGWRESVVIDDERSLEAKEKLRIWSYLLRWRRFPSLGAPPASWLRFGESPSVVAFVSVGFRAYLVAPAATSLNESNALLAFFRDA